MKKLLFSALALSFCAYTMAQKPTPKPAAQAPAPAAPAAPATPQPKLIEKVTAQPGELKIAYEKWELPNGLTLIIHEDHSDPIVHVEVTYHVGSARETPGKSGFAHFFEHMMFQGSLNVKDEEHFKIVEGAGGDMNGTTSDDRTNYFETLPKNYLETALWLEADRMGFLLDSVTQRKFEVQRATVKNEKDQRVTNQPYGRTDEIKRQILYPAGHPYSWPTIGYVEDLDRVTVEDLKNFFMRWYGPNNASLVVAGDVDPKEVIELTMKYFGSIPRGPEVKKQRVEPVRLPDDVYANYGDNIFIPATFIYFPTVPNFHPDEPALDILASILGQGNNSLMYQQLVKTEKVFSADAFHPCSELAGEFAFQVFSYPAFMSETNESPEDMVRKVFDEFEKRGVTDDDLKRFLGDMESGLISTMSSIASKSSTLSEWHYQLGNKTYNLNDELNRYKKVTKEDVMRVYRQYLKGRKAAIVNVFPKKTNAAAGGSDSKEKEDTKLANSSGTATASSELEYKGLSYTRPVDNFDRSKRPEIKDKVIPVVPQTFRTKFDNGMSVIGTQNNEIPTVTMIINMRGGNMILNDPSKAGLASLTAAMMEESTQKYTAEEFSSELSKLGSSISFSAGRDNTTIFVQCQKKHLDKTLELLEEKLMRPKFTAEEFKLNQKRLAEQINSMRVSPGMLAQRAFAKLIYGKSMAAEPVLGTIKTIKAMSVKDVQSYYDRFYSPSGTTVVVVGDITEREMLAKLEFMRNWAAKPVNMPPLVAAPQPLPKQPTIYLVDKYKATQSEIRIGYLALPYDYNGKFFKSTVMNYPLGGNFNSRLSLNLREDKGFTYGIGSGFQGSHYQGPYQISTSVRASATDSALREIVNVVKEYREKGITSEELTYTKKSLAQSDILRYETPFGKAGFLSQLVTYDLPSNYVDEQNKVLERMTIEEVNALAKEMLPLERMVMVIVGDKDKVQTPLEKLGYKVVEFKLD
jgi:zinc protease